MATNEINAPAGGENKMGTMPVNRLLITMALPMMISMLVQALYNVVDSIFVSRISEDALTAVSMAFPMQNLLIGLASGLAVGMNALVSRALGEKKQDTANQMAMHGVFLSACGYLIFLVIGLTIARWFFVVQGASDVIADYGYDYLSVVTCMSFGIFVEITFERMLQSTGKTIYTMFTQGLGAIFNIIFDPILIFGLFGAPKLGIAGAAWATVLGQILAGCLALIFNIKVNKELHLDFRKFRLDLKAIGQILYIGVPSVLMVAIGSVMTFSVNRILVVFSSTAVAVFGVYFKLQSFAFMPVFGLNNGMVPIIAYNYGALKPDRMIKTLKLAIFYATCIMVIAFAIFQILPEQLLLLFSASDEMLSIGVPSLRILSVCFLVAGANIVIGSFYQAVGNGIYSMLVSLFRQLVFLVPLAYLFSKTGNVNMVWLAWPIAEVAAVACNAFFMFRINRDTLRPLKAEAAKRENADTPNQITS
ncbi:MAG: MATE family efflux transporter [Lachnospiraceae bacterium]|nr:MATE family efflux transporter [Lachnospiraceae bacterium]